MTSFIGKKLDSGKSVKKNHPMENENSLYLENKRLAKRSIMVKIKKLIDVGASNILLETG